MSDMGLPFDDVSDADAGGRRKKLVLLAVVAVLVLVLGVFVVPKLLGGGSEPVAQRPSSGRTVPAKAKAKAKAKTKAKAKAKPVKKPKPFNGAVARDPFEPYFVPEEEREPVAPAPSAAPNPGSTPAPGLGGDPATSAFPFQLVDVKGSGSTATVTVLYKGVQYPDVAVGKTFADDVFKFNAALTASCAQFTMGDLPFALCEGQYATFSV